MRGLFKLLSALVLLSNLAIAGNERCNTTGLADSYVLALSSQPGFCETYGYEAGKPECYQLAATSYQATHLTLHGLWPNQSACGHRYGYCGIKPKSNHCDYAPLQLNDEISARLQQIMPSYYYGSCLERHEWNKHGSCQSRSADDYFALAMKWTQEMDDSYFGDYLRAHRGQYVLLSELRQALEQAFGPISRNAVVLSCKNKILVDINIQLPAVFDTNDSLETLMHAAPLHAGKDGCGLRVKISQFSKESEV